MIGDMTGPMNGARQKKVIATETSSTSKISMIVPDAIDIAGDANAPARNLHGKMILMCP